MPAEMLTRIERLAEKHSAESGFEIKVASVARKLLGEALDATEAKARRKR